ncbi:hypothetical protein AAMO2058_000116700 [Amorphochlora amoebiformis]
MPGFIDLTYGAKEEATTLAFEGVPQGSWDIDNSTIIHPHYSRVQHTIRENYGKMGFCMSCARTPSRMEQTVELRSGIQMPIFGLGTWLAKGKGECLQACQWAINAGYRMIDTAALYKNEEDVGQALQELKLDREDYFIVTKLHWDCHGRENVLREIEIQLKKLGLQYVDLYLMHSPKGGKVVETWNTLLEIKKKGLARAVGVSNFGIDQLNELKKTGVEMPEVNQIELHVWHQQKELCKYLKDEGIAVMGYCPLARVKRFGSTAVLKVAEELKVSEAQVAIRWSVQKGYITIPKSSNKKRIHDNADVFSWSIPAKLMAALDDVDEGFKASGSVNNQDIPWKDVA